MSRDPIIAIKMKKGHNRFDSQTMSSIVELRTLPGPPTKETVNWRFETSKQKLETEESKLYQRLQLANVEVQVATNVRDKQLCKVSKLEKELADEKVILLDKEESVKKWAAAKCETKKQLDLLHVDMETHKANHSLCIALVKNTAPSDRAYGTSFAGDSISVL